MVRFVAETLKVNLKLAIQRLQLLQKKKAEISKKSRKLIADLLISEKVTSARIKVEQIIREDYTIEALEILENFCEALSSRLGLILTHSNVDEGILEHVVTLIWVAPRLGGEVPEFLKISEQLLLKFGQKFFDTARSNCLRIASAKVVDCLGLQPPSSALVEQYLKAIADTYNVPFEPDIKDFGTEMNKVDSDLSLTYAKNSTLSNDSLNSPNIRPFAAKNARAVTDNYTNYDINDIPNENVKTDLISFSPYNSKKNLSSVNIDESLDDLTKIFGGAKKSANTSNTSIASNHQNPNLGKTGNLLEFDENHNSDQDVKKEKINLIDFDDLENACAPKPPSYSASNPFIQPETNPKKNIDKLSNEMSKLSKRLDNLK